MVGIPQVAPLVHEHCSDGAVLLDGSWTVVSVNPAATRLYRRRADELLGQDFLATFTGLNQAQLRAEFEAIRQQQVPKRIEVFFPGLFAWHSVLAVPAGAHLLLLSTDVTDRARREEDEAVRASLRRIFEHLPVLVTITRGREHRFDLVNEKARMLVGDRVKEGERVEIALPEAKAQGFVDLLDRVFDTGQRYEGKALCFHWTDSHGQEKTGFFDVVYEPLYGTSGDVTGIVHLAVDVTEHVRQQDALAGRARDHGDGNGRDDIQSRPPAGDAALCATAGHA